VRVSGAPEAMPTDAADLAHRLAAATAADTVRGLIFNAAFDVVRDALGPEQARAVDPQRKGSRIDFFSYPVADYLRIVFVAAEALAPKLGDADAAFRAFGSRALENVFASLLGRTILALANGDPRQLLSQVSAGYRATVAYGERTVTWPGERHARIHFRRDFLVPSFHCGVLEQALTSLGAQGAACAGRQTGFLELEIDARWA
jgi:uncharacterized protein (TIGR02265 family)